MRGSVSYYESLHRAAVCEALVVERDLAIAAIERATHVACDADGQVRTYGSIEDATEYADGLRGFTVRGITRDDKESQIEHKMRVYGRAIVDARRGILV